MHLGAHESVAGGIENAFIHGEADGCEAIQVWTRSSRAWQSKPLTDESVEAWRRQSARTGILPASAHASYLINLASTHRLVVERSLRACRDEIDRCARLGIRYLVLHPGSHLEAAPQVGIAQLAEHLERLLGETSEAADVTIALENTAGQGTNLGWRLEHLRDLLGSVADSERLAVCFDTCHAHAAGYDLTTDNGYAETFETFDRVLGLDKLDLFHVNDSKTERGSRRDRHAVIGEGTMGIEPFRRLVNDPRFRDRPALLETPSLPDGERSYGYCLELLKGLRHRSD